MKAKLPTALGTSEDEGISLPPLQHGIMFGKYSTDREKGVCRVL